MTVWGRKWCGWGQGGWFVHGGCGGRGAQGGGPHIAQLVERGLDVADAAELAASQGLVAKLAPVLRPGSAFNPSPAATFSPVRPPAPVMAQPAPDPHITSLHEEIQHLRTKILQRINEPEG